MSHPGIHYVEMQYLVYSYDITLNKPEPIVIILPRTEFLQ